MISISSNYEFQISWYLDLPFPKFPFLHSDPHLAEYKPRLSSSYLFPMECQHEILLWTQFGLTHEEKDILLTKTLSAHITAVLATSQL